MSVGVMSIRGSKFSTSNSRNKHHRALHHRGAQSFSRLNSYDYQDEIMDAYGGSYNFDYGVPSRHESIQTFQTVVDEDEIESNLQMLMNAFQNIDPSIVHDIFIAKNYDVCGTAQSLSGLMPPQSSTAVHHDTSSRDEQHNSDTDQEDGEWGSPDDCDDNVSEGSVDWVVVQDEWEVVDPSTTCFRSYSDVLTAPYSGDKTPFEYQTTSTSSIPTTAPPPQSKVENDSDEESICADYYGIKGYGERVRNLSNRRTFKSKNAAIKTTK